MSKLPFWLPPGLTSRNLPVFRVQGYPSDAPETFILLDAFAGSVKQFYKGQAQNYSLSAGAQWAKSVDRGDHQIQYKASHGTEVVTLKVHPKRASQLLSVEEGWWDSALVEVTIPATNGAVGEFSAFVIAPRLEEVLAGSVLPISGVAKESKTWATGGAHPNLIVAYPDFSELSTLDRGARDTQTASLRIDLRPFRGMTMVSVDLYGLIAPTTALEIVDSQFLALLGRDTDVSPYTVAPAGTPLLQAATLAKKNLAVSLFPELVPYGPAWVDNTAIVGIQTGTIRWEALDLGHFGISSAEWDGGSWLADPPADFVTGYPLLSGSTEWVPGVLKTRTVGGVRFIISGALVPTPLIYDNEAPPTPPEQTANTGSLVHSYPATGSDYIEYYEPEYGMVTTVAPRDAIVRGACFLGMPFDTWAQYTADGSQWHQWEISQVYPARPSLGVIGEVEVPGVEAEAPETPFNHWRQEKLGTINIDPRRPRGWVTFKPV